MGSRISRYAALVLSIAAAACGGGAGAGTEPAKSPRASEATPPDASAARQRVFATLARVDRRLASRVGKRAEGVALLFPENRAPAELAALFDFDARDGALRGERDRLMREAPDAPGEWRALRRLVDEELARVADERELPRAASEIVRSLALDLPIKESRPEDVREEDHALAATLDRLATSVAAGGLGPMQLAELDDSLDLFEKRSAALEATQGALARLRVGLSSVKPAAHEAVPAWTATRPRVEAFTGPLPDGFDHILAEARGRLKTRLDKALPSGRDDRDRLASAAVSTLLVGADCTDVALGGARGPIERRGMCALLASLATKKPSEPVEPAALLVLDLALDSAEWTLAVHERREEPAKVFARARTAVPLDELDAAHVFRFAFAHPAAAIAAGWAAALVVSDPARRGATWNSAGALRPADAAAMLGPDVM